MSNVADILTATVNGSAQTLTDLFEGLKMAGPQAAANLRGNMMEQRMFQATQEIERHTKKTAELMEDMKGGGTQTFQ